MESLGGDQLWIDRFLAEHAALLYFWVLVAFYLVSPSASYAFSELVEVGWERFFLNRESSRAPRQGP
jgi:ubiquinol oxidase